MEIFLMASQSDPNVQSIYCIIFGWGRFGYGSGLTRYPVAGYHTLKETSGRLPDSQPDISNSPDILFILNLLLIENRCLCQN